MHLGLAIRDLQVHLPQTGPLRIQVVDLLHLRAEPAHPRPRRHQDQPRPDLLHQALKEKTKFI